MMLLATWVGTTSLKASSEAEAMLDMVLKRLSNALMRCGPNPSMSLTWEWVWAFERSC